MSRNRRLKGEKLLKKALPQLWLHLALTQRKLLRNQRPVLQKHLQHWKILSHQPLNHQPQRLGPKR